METIIELNNYIALFLYNANNKSFLLYSIIAIIIHSLTLWIKLDKSTDETKMIACVIQGIFLLFYGPLACLKIIVLIFEMITGMIAAIIMMKVFGLTKDDL